MATKKTATILQTQLFDNHDLMWVEAIYADRSEDQGENNPLIRALPSFITTDKVLEAFRNVPSFSPKERELSGNARIDRIGSLNLYIEPLTCHPELIESIFRLITQGYAWRNPLVNIPERVRQHYEMSMTDKTLLPIVPPSPSHAACLALFGVSGVGKTTSINRILSFLPPVIHHKFLSGSGLQVVWIKTDCPPDGSINQLFHWILLEYDRLLGTRYAKEVGRNSRLDHLINKVAAVAKYHHTGVIVIDEIQFALKAAKRRGDELLDFLVTFSNVIGVPLMIAGTPKALSLFESSFRLARRASDDGTLIYTNLEFDAEWTHFLERLFEFQWIKHPIDLTPQVSKALYDVTQGIHSLVIRIFQLTQIAAIHDKSETITINLIQDISKERFGPVQPMLDALRSKKRNRIELYEDLLVSTLAGLESDLAQETRNAQLKKATERRQANTSQLSVVSTLVSMGILEAHALKVVSEVMGEESSLNGFDLLRASLSRIDEQSKPSVELRSPSGPTLTKIVQGSANVDEALISLKRTGVVK